METADDDKKRSYGFWGSFVHSFFSKYFYQDVGEKWKGTGYGYLFILIILVSLLRAADLQWEFYEQIPGLVKKIPDLKMAKGELSVDTPQPYSYQIQDFGFILDTTGKINSLDEVPNIDNYQAFLLLNKTKMVLRRSRFGFPQDQTTKFSRLPSFALNQEKLAPWGETAIRWSGSVYFLILFLLWLPFEFVAILIYGLIGLLFSQMAGRKLSFQKALRLAVASHVPGLMIGTILFFFAVHYPLADFDFPGQGVCFFGLACAYLYFAVWSQKGPEPPPVPKLN